MEKKVNINNINGKIIVLANTSADKYTDEDIKAALRMAKNGARNLAIVSYNRDFAKRVAKIFVADGYTTCDINILLRNFKGAQRVIEGVAEILKNDKFVLFDDVKAEEQKQSTVETVSVYKLVENNNNEDVVVLDTFKVADNECYACFNDNTVYVKGKNNDFEYHCKLIGAWNPKYVEYTLEEAKEQWEEYLAKQVATQL